MRAGALLVDKPEGLTSHDVVVRVRKLLGERRIGHTGTLDPMATGLLLLLVGRTTRLARFLAGAKKTYRASVAFGQATDTYDRTGTPVGPFEPNPPDRKRVEEALRGFLGPQSQVPPIFSAKKRGGERLHRLARRGTPVTPEPVPIEIFAIEVLAFRGSELEIELSVSSGTYIRSLAHDLGVELGVGAHLRALRRTQIGSFSLPEAVRLEELEALEAREREALLLAPSEALRELEAVRVGPEAAVKLRHGRPLRFDEAEPPWEEGAEREAPPLRLVDRDARLLAVGQPDAESGAIRPLLVFADVSGEPRRR